MTGTACICTSRQRNHQSKHERQFRLQCSGDSYGGNVFELAPTATGWTETVFANFCSDTGPGGVEGIVFDASGTLYGITYAGGTYGGGAASKIAP